MGEHKPIPHEDWRTVVRSVPLVSVDLVVEHDGAVVLGKRTNDPAKGEWFVPGGTVHKHERLVDAVQRITREELGIDTRINRQLGVYEHFWETAEMEDVDGKHYAPIGFHLTAERTDVTPDDQHASFRWFTPPFDAIELHPYVRTYLEDAGIPATPR